MRAPEPYVKEESKGNKQEFNSSQRRCCMSHSMHVPVFTYDFHTLKMSWATQPGAIYLLGWAAVKFFF